MELRDFRAARKNTLLGFFTLALDSGLVIRDCALHESHGKRWFAFPARAVLDGAGNVVREGNKVRYAAMIECPDRARLDLLQAKVVALASAIVGEVPA